MARPAGARQFLNPIALGAIVAAYVVAAEAAKRWFYRRHPQAGPPRTG